MTMGHVQQRLLRFPCITPGPPLPTAGNARPADASAAAANANAATPK